MGIRIFSVKVKHIMEKVHQIQNVTNSHVIHVTYTTQRSYHVRWNFLESSWIKINFDGPSKSNPDQGRCGGIIRDEAGNWLVGFAANLGTCTAYAAELWGILYGMEVVWRHGFRRIIVEADSLSIISSLRDGTVGSKRTKFFRRTFDWKNRDWDVKFSHTFREGNICANWLANWSLSQDIGFLDISRSFGDLSSLILILLGSPYPIALLSCNFFFVWALAPLSTKKKTHLF